MNKGILAAIFLAAVANAGEGRREGMLGQRTPTVQTNVLSGTKLRGFLNTICPWPEWTTNYSQACWSNLIVVARYIQVSSPASVAAALKEYESEYPYRSDRPPANRGAADTPEIRAAVRRIDTKLFLLMRVVFEIPEHSSSMERYYPWRTRGGEENSDGTVNAAWPLTWRKGYPQLLAGDTGIQGRLGVYQVRWEYLHFSEEYKMRNLSAVQFPKGMDDD